MSSSNKTLTEPDVNYKSESTNYDGIQSLSLERIPPELRLKIYQYLFSGKRISVSAAEGCHCSTNITGPYNTAHRWLIDPGNPKIRYEAQRAFITMAIWEMHCVEAFHSFVSRLEKLHALEHVRHIRLNVLEIDSSWNIPLDRLPNLKSATFSPWQLGWSIDVRAMNNSNELTDTNIMAHVRHVLREKVGYKPVRELLDQKRNFTIFFVFPLRYLTKDNPERWQLKIWRANLDDGTIDRNWFWNMGTLRVNDIDIAYTLHTPPRDKKGSYVVLINGLADTKETWSYQVPALLDAGYSVLTYDNRGIGASSRPSGMYTASMMASDLRGLVDGLSIQTPFHVVGVSMGGMIAQAYALEYSSDIRSLTLACTYAAPGPFCSRMFNMWADIARKMDVATVMRDVTLWAFTQEFFKPARRAELEESEAAMRDLDMKTDEYLSQLNVIQTFDTTKDLSKLERMPVMTLAGEEDILIPVSLSRELHDMIRGSKWVTVKGGHGCMWEFPDSFNAALVEFLNSIWPL